MEPRPGDVRPTELRGVRMTLDSEAPRVTESCREYNLLGELQRLATGLGSLLELTSDVSLFGDAGRGVDAGVTARRAR